MLGALGEADLDLPAWPEVVSAVPAGRVVSQPPILFRKLDVRDVERLRGRFSGR